MAFSVTMNVESVKVTLTQQQVDAITPILNMSLAARMPTLKFEAKCKAAMEAAGCPISASQG